MKKRNCIVLTAIRSGSTYLINMLKATGYFTYPRLYSDHHTLVPQSEICEFFAPNKFLDPWYTGSTPKTKKACIDHLRHRIQGNRCDGSLIKVLVEHYHDYNLGDEDRWFMEELFPEPKYIWLEREDRAARAVSAYLFFKYKLGHIWNQKTQEEYLSKKITVDMDGLFEVYKNHARPCDWTKFLEGSDYHKVQYEDLVDRPVETLEAILKYLGVSSYPRDIVNSMPKFRTSRPESDFWIQKLKCYLESRKMI